MAAGSAGHAEELDRPVRRGRGGFRRRAGRPRARHADDPHLHHPARHAVRGHVHGPVSGTSAGPGAHGPRQEEIRGRLHRPFQEEDDPGTGRPQQGKIGALHRRPRSQPRQRETDPDLHRRLRAHVLRDRRDHGGTRPRPARFRFRQEIRPSGHHGHPAAGGPTAGPPNGSARGRRDPGQLRTLRRSDRRRGQGKDHRGP